MKLCIYIIFLFYSLPVCLFSKGGAENIELKIIDHKILPDDTVGRHDFISFYLDVSNISITKDGKKKAMVITEEGGIITKEVGGMNPRIVVKDVLTNRVKFISGYPSSQPKWSPSGEWLAYTKRKLLPGKFFRGKQLFGDQELRVWKEGQNEKLLTPKLSVIDFFWTQNSKTILFDAASEKGKSLVKSLMTVDVLNGTLNEIDEVSGFSCVGYSLSPDGSMIAYVKVLKEELHTEWIPVESDVYVANIDGSGKKRLARTDEVETYLKWLPNNKILVERWKLDKIKGRLKERKFVYFYLKKRGTK